MNGGFRARAALYLLACFFWLGAASSLPAAARQAGSIQWPSAQALAFLGRSAGELSAGQVRTLQLHVRKNPQDSAARQTLTSWYWRQTLAGYHPHLERLRQIQIFWLIANRPQSAILSVPPGQILETEDPVAYASAKKLWEAAARAHPNDVLILAAAASSLGRVDTALADRWLARAERLEPRQVVWNDARAALWKKAALRRPDKARLALRELQSAQDVDSSAFSRFNRLQALAMDAYLSRQTSLAENYARAMLRQAAASWRKSWDYANAVNRGHEVLGLCALRRGDKARAGRELLLAGRCGSSPQLASFGPNMLLAQALLKAGNRGPVMDYLNECRGFWHSAVTGRWLAQIRAGRVPEFGSNLVY